MNRRTVSSPRQSMGVVRIFPSRRLRCKRMAVGVHDAMTTRPEYASELLLAAACARGDARALARFEKQFLSKVEAYVARLDSSPAFADEVRQLLRTKLFVSEAGGPPKIAAYRGTGPLGGWLRVAAIRTARDLLRSRKRHDAQREPAGLHLRPQAPDPELRYLKQHYARELGEAFERTIAALSPKQRNVLTLHFLEGMSSSAIGQLYGVTGAAVRLWIKDYREALLAETRRILAERLKLGSAELDSVVGLVQSQLDVSISRLFKRR